MPAATSSKRVKNTRIERPFIIGSEAWPLDDLNRPADTPEDHTKGWRVYVRAPEGQPDISRWLKKVQFKIYHTYNNPTRLVDAPPFQIEETGWGGFNIEVRLFFVAEVGSKPEYRNHFLQLETYGDEATQAKQKEEKMVRSEFLDYVEFNEPTETLYEALTDEAQWPTTKKPKGKGKGKTDVFGKGQGTARLPDISTPTNQFSMQLEGHILALLKKVEKEVEDELESVNKDRKKLEAELKELQKPTKE